MTGLEAIAINEVGKLVIKTVWEGGGKVLALAEKSLTKEIEQKIYRATDQYSQNYDNRHGVLKVLGMQNPVLLESVYTGVQFLDEQDIRRFGSIADLEEAYRQAQKRSYQPKNGQKQEGLNVANEEQYLMVLGGPGAGKSTFLRRMGLEALKRNQGGFKHDCIPVFIELKQFSSGEVNIEKAIAKEFEICNLPFAQESTKELLKQGKLLVLLDGLDEVPTDNKNEAIERIQDFVDQYHKNRFIASCRTAAYRSQFRRFADVTMADFDDAQIEQFIGNWFQSEADKKAGTAQKCWEILQKSENQAAKELAQTPLLLTFLCLVYDESQRFPENRSELYSKALRILLEKWAAEKRINRETLYQGLHTGLEEILLSEIAYTNFEADRLFFSEREIVEQIKTFLTGNLNAPQHLDSKSVLNAIAVQQGILVERADDVFSFSHLTLQEYLTAQYIDDHRLIEPLVREHLADQRWQEVFLLVAGLMRGGADELLSLMEKEAQKYIAPKLQNLLMWADSVTSESEGNFKPVAKRAFAIAYAMAMANAGANSIGYALLVGYAYTIYTIANPNADANAYAIKKADANAYAIKKAGANTIAKAIAEAITNAKELEETKIFKTLNFTVLIARLEALKGRIPDEQQPKEVYQKFVERVQQTCLEAFKLNLKSLFCREEAESLFKYLYVNHLMLRCKEAAARVSPKTWNAIEERMLLPSA